MSATATAKAGKRTAKGKTAVGKAVAAAPAPDSILDADGLRKQAREAYGRFQRGWFEFAKAVTAVHDTEAWGHMGYENFKEYCHEEFVDLDYSNIVKFVRIVKGYWGKAIESRLKKDPAADLPAWDTCYQLTAAEQRFPKEQIPKLRKEVLDGKISGRQMREQVRSLADDTTLESGKKKTKSVEREVEGATAATNADADSVEAEVIDVDDHEALAAEMIVHAKALADNLPHLSENVKEGGQKTVKLASVLWEDVYDQIADYVNHMEEIG